MASVGEAAAHGLESGFRLAMDYHTKQRAADREDAAAARQLVLDQRALDDHTRAVAEHQDARELSALSQQHQQVQTELQTHANNGTQPSEELQQRADAIDKMRTAKLGKMGGYDPATVQKEAAAAAEAINRGDIDSVLKTPGALTKAVTATGFAPSQYLRGPQGEPSEVEQNVAKLMKGMESGDQDMTIEGANGVFKSRLNTGIGSPGAQGGTIVGKRFIHMVQDPNSTPENPRVIPTVRVYVNNGKQEASGDEIRARRSMDPDAPPGATGHYDTVLTQNRSTAENDPVKAISINDAMDVVGKHMQLAELLNKPEMTQALQEDAKAGWDPARALRVQAAYGITQPKVTTTKTPIPAGGSLYEETTDRQGKVTGSKIIQGNDKQFRPGLFEQAQAYAEENNIPIEDALKLMQHYGVTKQPSKYSEGANPNGGEHEGGLSKGEERLVKQQLASLKQDREDLKTLEGRVLSKYEADIKGTTPSRRAAADKERRDALDALDNKRKTIDEQSKKLQDRLEVTVKPSTVGLASGGGIGGSGNAENRVDLLREAGGLAGAPAALKNIRDQADKQTNPETKRIINAEGDRLEAAVRAAQPAASGVKYARNPKTGERRMLKDGQWVPVK